jgi:hypothetical protein
VAADPLSGLSPTGVAHLSQSKLLPLLLQEANTAADQLRQLSSGQVRPRSAYLSVQCIPFSLLFKLRLMHSHSVKLLTKL